ncbi:MULTISPECIES: Pycsar system effector family protein [Chitinophagaceae]
MISYSELDQKAEQQCRDIIGTHPRPALTYHNMLHIRHVVGMVTILCDFYQYDERKKYLIRIAAWFHDIGYYLGDVQEHETIGAQHAVDFLKENGVAEEDISLVRGCILATHMPQHPQSQTEQIICDADLSHLSEPDFYNRSKDLRKEMEKLKGAKIEKTAWLSDTLHFMQSQQYFTSYGKEKLEIGKQANILFIQQKIQEALEEKATKTSEKKEDKPSKGIETMFRITSSNNQKLSAMADNKAHILISVNSIILSAIISLLLRKLTEYEYLSIPTYIILAVSVVSMIFSLIATRPNLPSGEFSKEDVDNKKVNLLFFGNFYRMSLEDYTKGMTAVMDDYNYLYQSLIKDVYAQGVVLSRKYKLLRISYTVFMFGMMLSVIAFIVASILQSHVK